MPTLTQIVKQSKRSELVLTMEVLRNTSSPIKKTNLSLKTRINFQQLESRLDLLVSKGLVEFITDPFNGYKITSKGLQLIGIWDNTTVNIPLKLTIKSKIQRVKH